MSSGDNSKAEDVVSSIEQLSLVSFRHIDEVKKLAYHLDYVINHPVTQKNRAITNYLKRLNEFHKRAYLAKRDSAEIEYMYCPEGHKEQRHRFNSLTVNDVSEILKINDWITSTSVHEHLCIQCNANIEINDEEPLMESLQKHFSLEVHRPKSVVDVSEPIILPNMSRRKSALESTKALTPANLEKLEQLAAIGIAPAPVPKKREKLDKMFSAKLETSLIRNLPGSSENKLDAAVEYYQNAFDSLVNDISKINLTSLKHTVAPIIMSIKDNVNQNYTADENKSFDNDEPEKIDKQEKNQAKKQRYYGAIETAILKLLLDHKMISLVDERTGKLAFFCICCEYYTLRFKYDSVLSHVFSDMHVHNLATILAADEQIKGDHRCVERIQEMNYNFLKFNYITKADAKYECGLCKVYMETSEGCLVHIIDDSHLGRLADEIVKTSRCGESNPPPEWGQPSLDWFKYLTTTNKSHNFKDFLLVENFIKPSGKFANYCTGCDMTLKGPRQLLFSHVRQKKHLRIAAPHKLQLLYKNYCRPVEYYASFGNFYTCYICQTPPTPSFGSIVEHIESDAHVECIAKHIKCGHLAHIDDTRLFDNQCITVTPHLKCVLCDLVFSSIPEAVAHVLGNLEHGNLVTEKLFRLRKFDIIEVYMRDRLILHSEGSTFNCVRCGVKFGSLRSLLMHLVYADHIHQKLPTESVFRFYLELKYNVNMMIRNRYSLLDFGRVKCGVCDAFLEDGDNVKKHVTLSSHREKSGGSPDAANESHDAANE